MSAFLGPIHNWLFEKIKFQEALIQEIVQKNNAFELLRQTDEKYGKLEEGELSDIIDKSNIHGWLQQRVSLVENRLAFIVFALTNENEEKIKEIVEIAFDFGKKNSIAADNVSQAYKKINDLLLNGMPCDRVNNITQESEDILCFEETIDIHEKYWENIGADAGYFYRIRNSVIMGMLNDSNIDFYEISKYKYELRKKI